MKNENNATIVAGTIATEPKPYDCCGEPFYSFDLSVKRDSGTEDMIPVNASELIVGKLRAGDTICLSGQIRTYNKTIDGKGKLVVVFFALEVQEYERDKNEVELTGYFCKTPNYRVTPLGRDICDVLLAVNGERGKSAYIPLIIWGRTARHIGTLDIGAHVSVRGRFQSRKYTKVVGAETVSKTAYEVSVNRIEEVCDERRDD